MTYEGLPEFVPRGSAPERLPAFSWRDYQPKDLLNIGTSRDYSPHVHAALREECEALMDKIAVKASGIDFIKSEGGPLLSMIAWGKERGIVSAEQAEELTGFYDPVIGRTLH